MRDRPALNFLRLEHRLAECRARQAIVARVGAEPDQVSVPLDEHGFGVAAAPAVVILHLPTARRQEPGHFAGLGGIGNIRDAHSGDEMCGRNDMRIRGPRRDEALRIVRSKTPAGQAEISVGRILGRQRLAEQADDLGLARIAHIDHLHRLIGLAAVRLDGLRYANDDVGEPPIAVDHREHGMVWDTAHGLIVP